MKLFVLLCFAAAAFGQGTPYDCFSVFSFTAASSQTGQNNASSQSPCVAWRVTYTTTGFSSVTVKFQTSPDNSSWSDVTNSVCSSSVQPPCVTDGANPLDAGVQGSASFRAYGKYVRVSVTSVTGSGSGQIVTYGYKGTSASAGLGGAGGSAASPAFQFHFDLSAETCTVDVGTGSCTAATTGYGDMSNLPGVTVTHNLNSLILEPVCNQGATGSGPMVGSDTATSQMIGAAPASTGVYSVWYGATFAGKCSLGTLGRGADGANGSAVTTTTQTSCFDFGSDNASSDLSDADIGPQGRIFMLPVSSTILEITVSANAGTPSVIVQKNHTGSATDLISGALATASSGAVACASTAATCIDGTSKSGAVSIVTAGAANVLAAGDWIQTKTGSSFASSGAKRLSVCITCVRGF